MLGPCWRLHSPCAGEEFDMHMVVQLCAEEGNGRSFIPRGPQGEFKLQRISVVERKARDREATHHEQEGAEANRQARNAGG